MQALTLNDNLQTDLKKYLSKTELTKLKLSL